jgi:hypothetical protein
MVEDKSWGMLFVICDTRRSDIDNRVKSRAGGVLRFLTRDTAEDFISRMGWPRDKMVILRENEEDVRRRLALQGQTGSVSKEQSD